MFDKIRDSGFWARAIRAKRRTKNMPKHVFRNPTPSAKKMADKPALRLRSGLSSLEMVHWTILLAFG
jgi:hypothetical protein